MTILTLLSGLMISAVAIYYSVSGLTNIFAAAVWPIIIMGTSLELAKLVATTWLKKHWQTSPWFLKSYLLMSVLVLMLITSMGIFGYLSKAHSDQTLVSGDVTANLAVYDEKIKTLEGDINANRRALKQMDEQVDQLLGRTQDAQGAQRAVSVRNRQKSERDRLQAEIQANQKTISQLREERAPIAAQFRKVEAEVGPIKYIAALIYGDNPNTDVLEKAVRWVIIMLVLVFDPLAISLLLASQFSYAEYLAEKSKKAQTPPEVVSSSVENILEKLDQIPDVEPEVAADSLMTQEEFNDPEVTEFFDRGREIAQDLDKDSQTPIAQTEELVFEDDDLSCEEDQEFVIVQEEQPASAEITHEYLKTPWVWIPSSVSLSPVLEPVATPAPLLPPTPAPTAPPVVTKVGGDYVSFDGKLYHYKALDPHSKSADQVVENNVVPSALPDTVTYVQNEEQQESGQWSSILNRPISEDVYLAAARNNQARKDV